MYPLEVATRGRPLLLCLLLSFLNFREETRTKQAMGPPPLSSCRGTHVYPCVWYQIRPSKPDRPNHERSVRPHTHACPCVPAPLFAPLFAPLALSLALPRSAHTPVLAWRLLGTADPRDWAVPAAPCDPKVCSYQNVAWSEAQWREVQWRRAPASCASSARATALMFDEIDLIGSVLLTDQIFFYILQLLVLQHSACFGNVVSELCIHCLASPIS